MVLITWNVQWFCGVDGVVDVARLLRAARDIADFDILCLQEVARAYPQLPGGGADDQLARLRAALPDHSVHFGAAVDELGDDGVTRRLFGNVIASRLPVPQIRHHALPYPAEAGIESMPRSALAATVLAPWGPLRVVTTHLEYYSQAMRLAQVHELRRLQAEAAALARHAPAPGDPAGPFRARPHTIDCVVTGDFNAAPGSPEYLAMLAPTPDGCTPTFADAWVARHGARAQPATFRVHDRRDGMAPIACDFVFVTDTLVSRLRDIVVDTQTQASDHQPLCVTLD